MIFVLAAACAVLIAALVAVNIAYIRHLERKDARHDSQVGRLLQRIQAPEQAVIDHSIAAQPASLPAVDSNDDHDYWRAQEEALRKMEAYESRLA